MDKSVQIILFALFTALFYALIKDILDRIKISAEEKKSHLEAEKEEKITVIGSDPMDQQRIEQIATDSEHIDRMRTIERYEKEIAPLKERIRVLDKQYFDGDITEAEHKAQLDSMLRIIQRFEKEHK